MPFVSIKMLEGRTKEQKKNLIESITKSVAESLNIDEKAVWVVVEALQRQRLERRRGCEARGGKKVASHPRAAAELVADRQRPRSTAAAWQHARHHSRPRSTVPSPASHLRAADDLVPDRQRPRRRARRVCLSSCPTLNLFPSSAHCSLPRLAPAGR